jgi:tripartite-type tricarboxylate transporter receptor subunit TctC
LIAVSALVLGLIAGASAQTFPSRQITIIVPFPPGGPTDQLSRLLAQKLTTSLQQQVIVDNRPGAGGQIGANALMQAPADGHTLFIADIGALAINASLYAKLSYDPLRDFQPITNLISMPQMLVVPQASEPNSVAELLALAKARPGGLNFVSQGIGTGGHLAAEMFKSRTGANMVHIPMKGSPAAIGEMLGGRADLLFEGLGVALPNVRAGKLKALALTTARRSALLPQVPTTPELGYPDIILEAWFGAVARAGTPAATVRRLNEELIKALNSPDVAKRFTDLGFDLVPSSPEQFAAFMKDEIARWGVVVKASGASVD